MVAPNYMSISAYPLTMSRSTNGTVSGEIISIESFGNMNNVRSEFSRKLKGKIVLLGRAPKRKALTDNIEIRLSEEQLKKMDEKVAAKVKVTPLPELFEGWKTSDKSDEAFLRFLEAEGALAVLTTRSMNLRTLHPGGTYYFINGDLKT